MTDSNGSETKVSIKGLGEFSHTVDLLTRLMQITGPVHDPDHEYENDPEHPGRCKHCQWFKPEEQKTLECGHTPLEHLQRAIPEIMVATIPQEFNMAEFKLLLLIIADELGLELDLPEREIGILRGVLEIKKLNARLGALMSLEVMIIETTISPRPRRWPWNR